MISPSLKLKFEKVIEISDVDWSIIDKVAISDANVLRPIKGVSFEEWFVKTLKTVDSSVSIVDGAGDSDIDLTVNGHDLQLKTPVSGVTKIPYQIGIALHKTHGNEKRPYNLYSTTNPTFEFLVFPHPQNGIFIVPYSSIPQNNTYKGYLDDPAIFPYQNQWINRWDLIGLPQFKGKSIESRTISQSSCLPNLSKETYLEDFEIVEMLCKPQYFRAAVMGLKGNIKEFWFIEEMKKIGLSVRPPRVAYSKYDIGIINKQKNERRTQVKGTSKNMCSLIDKTIGFEIMGTHGQFPERGYKKSYFDYVAVVISQDQLPSTFNLNDGLHFLFIHVDDLPLHYLIGNGKPDVDTGTGNKRWNLSNFNDVLYPNIKLKFNKNTISGNIEFLPDISSYSSQNGLKVIPINSKFRTAGPFILDRLPQEFI